MHFKENLGRPQSLTNPGKERIKIAFPKQKRLYVLQFHKRLVRKYNVTLPVKCLVLIYISNRVCQHIEAQNCEDLFR